MADSAVDITAGSGTSIDTRTEASNGNHRQVIVIGDPSTNAGVAPVDVTNGLSVTLTTALPAGTAAVGKLAANSGIDIGDVDVTSLVPGVTATSLGKAEDAAHSSGDVGVMALSVRQDTAGALAGTDADYQPLITDASGRLHVNVGNTVTVGSHAVTNAGTFAVQATLQASTNTTEVVGDVAHDAVVAGNPLLIGAEARMSLGTAVAEGDAVRIAATRYGILLTTAMIPSRASSNATPIAATTTGVIAAPSAGSHLRVVRIHMSNGGSTSTWIAIRDGAAGTQFYRTFLPLNGAMSLNLSQSGPLDLTTATRLDIVLSAAGSVEYTIDYLTVAD